MGIGLRAKGAHYSLLTTSLLTKSPPSFPTETAKFTLMKNLLILLILISCFSSPRAQEAEIRATIDTMFQAMYRADTATMSTCFIPGANLFTYSYDSRGNPRAKGESLHDFLRGVGLMGPMNIEERLLGWQCLVDDGIASVWTPYELYLDDKFNHCGVNSFQFIRVQGVWKISLITDTRRKEDCVSHDLEKRVIDSLINVWHHSAAVADEKTFFRMMDEDAIYIGTDASERWIRDELKEWSKDYFERETAWNFTPLSRNIRLGPGGQIAWFDELLDTWMGTCRSTGIISQKDGEWKIVYYHLSVTIPNEKIDDFRALIQPEKE